MMLIEIFWMLFMVGLITAVVVAAMLERKARLAFQKNSRPAVSADQPLAQADDDSMASFGSEDVGELEVQFEDFK